MQNCLQWSMSTFRVLIRNSFQPSLCSGFDGTLQVQKEIHLVLKMIPYTLVWSIYRNGLKSDKKAEIFSKTKVTSVITVTLAGFTSYKNRITISDFLRYFSSCCGFLTKEPHKDIIRATVLLILWCLFFIAWNLKKSFLRPINVHFLLCYQWSSCLFPQNRK